MGILSRSVCKANDCCFDCHAEEGFRIQDLEGVLKFEKRTHTINRLGFNVPLWISNSPMVLSSLKLRINYSISIGLVDALHTTFMLVS